MPSLPPTLFSTVTTPSPTELAFYQLVADTSMRPDKIPELGTTYEAWASTFSPTVRKTEGWSEYVYLFTDEGPVMDGVKYRAFYFGKHKSLTDKKVPFQSFVTCRNYAWPPVLEELQFVKDWTLPVNGTNAGGAVSVPRVYARQKLVPAAVVDSRCRVQRFLADSPWPDQVFNHRQPIPTDVSWQLLGNSDSVGRCLHPDITIQGDLTSGQIVYGSGTQGSTSLSGSREQFFPATNFPNWAPFVLEDTQVPIPRVGLWLRERVVIFPPPRPPSSIS